ncbi:MAG: VWA domain-containing protein [Betaproteobacteria bacterium]
MDDPHEFDYRLPRRARGRRLGTHRATAVGAGLEFLTTLSLFDHPDPRRLDLRASLANLRGDWLVRANRQHAAIGVQVLIDVSASMRFGAPRKLDVAADFVEALGRSAARVGDALGMVAFDATAREDLHVAPRRGRGVGELMAALLRECDGGAGDGRGLRGAAQQLLGRPELVFVVSDYLWPLDGLADALDLLAPAHIMPIVVRDRAEIEPPPRDGAAMLVDAETGHRRTLWVRPALRARWHAAIAARATALEAVFAERDLRPFTLLGAFDANALSGHLLAEDA